MSAPAAFAAAGDGRDRSTENVICVLRDRAPVSPRSRRRRPLPCAPAQRIRDLHAKRFG
jgi:hypothetical protein